MRPDPITIEIVRHLLEAASRDIRRVVEHAAYSPILYEVIDFSCGIIDAEGNLIAETPGLPIFLANLGYSVKATYTTIGKDNIKDGDVILCNDPYNGGYTHCPDIVVLCPAFSEGEIRGWAAFRGHTVDMGGIYPGGWYADTTEVFQEGVRIPPVKIVKEGKVNTDIINIIKSNCRVPDPVLGDIRAMIAGVKAGSKRISRIIDKYGLQETLGVMSEILRQGNELGRTAIKNIPDGVYRAEVVFDGSGNDDAMLDVDVPLKMSISVDGDNMKIDFTGTGTQSKGPLNLPFASTVSAVFYGFKIICSPDLPSNEGFFQNIEIVAPGGTIVNPNLPAATSNWPTVATSIPDMVLKALAPAMPTEVRGGHFGDSMAHFFYGNDPEKKEFYISAEPDAGGYGGGAISDGESALHSMALGDTLNMSAEVAEARFPFRIERLELIQDSGGAGESRGGLGCRRQYKILGHDAGLTVTSDRVLRTPPWGLFGGNSGKANITRILKKDGSVVKVRKTSNTIIHDGETVCFEPGGGGGYGHPYDRTVQNVLNDVIDGYVSSEKAASDYGVVIEDSSGDYKVDIDATTLLRSKGSEKKRSEKKPNE